MNSETILLLEDDEGVRVLLTEVLEARGYTVLACAGSEEALHIAGDYPGPIHLLITDVVMPRMNGPEASAALRRLRPEMQLLYISGYGDDVLRQRGALDAGAFLQKPFSPERLVEKIHQVLAS